MDRDGAFIGPVLVHKKQRLEALGKARKGAALLALALLALSAVPAPAAAVGTSIQLSVTPPNVTGKPGIGASGPANFSGFVELFSNPIGQVTIAIAIDSQLGWSVSPASFSWRTATPKRFDFNFTVDVPANASADLTDTATVTATARTGGITTATETASVYVTSGGYYAAEARRLTPSVVMEVGKQYVIEYDLRNTGNARASFTYAWADKAVNDKVRAEMLLPQGVALAGFGNETIQFFVTPGTTTPGGKFQVPVRVELRDRPGALQAVVNLSIEMEFTNAPIFQGLLPNWDFRAPYTFLGWTVIVLGIWFTLHLLVALLGGTRNKVAHPSEFVGALKRHLRRDPLVRGAGALRDKVRRRPKAAAKRPDEVRGRAAAAGRPPR